MCHPFYEQRGQVKRMGSDWVGSCSAEVSHLPNTRFLSFESEDINIVLFSQGLPQEEHKWHDLYVEEGEGHEV